MCHRHSRAAWSEGGEVRQFRGWAQLICPSHLHWLQCRAKLAESVFKKLLKRRKKFIILNIRAWTNTPLYNSSINISTGIINTGLTSSNQWDGKGGEGRGGKRLTAKTHIIVSFLRGGVTFFPQNAASDKFCPTQWSSAKTTSDPARMQIPAPPPLPPPTPGRTVCYVMSHLLKQITDLHVSGESKGWKVAFG